MQHCALGDDCDGECGDSFEKKAKMLESKLAPTILTKQAILAGSSCYRTYVI